jgi:DNA-binding transcriptional ArsR family regulator
VEVYLPAKRLLDYRLPGMLTVHKCLPRRRGVVRTGDPTRRAIVACLAERPWAVGELAAVLPVSRPAVSQALKVLKDAGLVSERAAGTRRIYRLNATAVAALRDQLDTFWNRALAAYGDVVEQPAERS